MGGIKNGELLALAAREFDALITVDKNLRYRQTLPALPIAVIVLNAQSNELQSLLAFIPLLEEALAKLQPRFL